MSLQDIQDLAGRRIVESDRPWGTHFINRGNTDLWLDLGESGLEAILLSRVDGWRIMSTRSSPQENLCTGQLGFFLRIVWTAELEGADVFLDGRKVDASEWSGPYLVVSAGSHELRIEKEGYAPIARTLELGREDEGHQRIDLTQVQLSPAG